MIQKFLEEFPVKSGYFRVRDVADKMKISYNQALRLIERLINLDYVIEIDLSNHKIYGYTYVRYR